MLVDMERTRSVFDLVESYFLSLSFFVVHFLVDDLVALGNLSVHCRLPP